MSGKSITIKKDKKLPHNYGRCYISGLAVLHQIKVLLVEEIHGFRNLGKMSFHYLKMLYLGVCWGLGGEFEWGLSEGFG